ncbi:MAG: MerR family transcriptional regulator [Actinomycetota bacterium]
MHQIGEAADSVGLSLRTIRHYEEVGLVLPSGRTAGGFRLYTDQDIDRLRLVRHMKPLEFSLEEMRDLLGVRDQLAGSPDDSERKSLAERLGMYAAAAEQRCEKLRDQLEAVTAVASMLSREASGKRPSGVKT